MLMWPLLVCLLLLHHTSAQELCRTLCSRTATACICSDSSTQLSNLQCYPSWRTLQLTTSQLTKLTDSRFSRSGCQQLTSLTLKGAAPSLTSLPANVFNGLTNLKTLSISYERLQQLSNGVFYSLNNLQELQLDRTKVRTLTRGSLRGLTDLLTLKLTNNYVNKLEDGVFTSTPNLTTLILFNNNVTHLYNRTLFGLTNLRILRANTVTHIEKDALSSLINLEDLTLMAITNTLSRIWTDLDVVFRPLKKLRVLKLLDTKITARQLPLSPLETLEKLEELSLDGNVFDKVDRRLFVGLRKLVRLSMRRNQLKCIYNRNFASLGSTLRELDLRDNKLTYIGRDAFLGLRKLRKLRLRGNPLMAVQAGTFCSQALPSLQNAGTLAAEINRSYSGHNITEPCPPDFKTDLLNFYQQCLQHKDVVAPGIRATQKPDRRSKSEYFLLLIIVAICVVFLLVAIALILSYRAWSKRKNKQLVENMSEAQEMVPVAAVGDTNGKPQQQDSSRHSPSPAANGDVGVVAAPPDKSAPPETKPLIPEGAPTPVSVPMTVATDADGSVITTLAVV